MSLVPYVQLPSNASTNNENRVVVHPNHGGGAIVPFTGRPTAAVQEILHKVVADRTIVKYVNENVILMLWLFDQDPETFLMDWFVHEALTANEKDIEEKSQNRRYLRETCKKRLKAVKKTDMLFGRWRF